MKHASFLIIALIAIAGVGSAQVGGNAGGYGGNNNYSSTRQIDPNQNELNKRAPIPAELKADNTATFIEASVLMNVKADEYVAVFGVATTGETVAAANAKMEETVAAFNSSIQKLGIKAEDVYVDFVSQTKIYGYRLQGTVAKEQLVGFEVKKNVAVHFADKTLIDKLTIAAADASIYDLVKVDYIVKDPAAIQDKLMAEAARLIKAKVERQRALLGINLTATPQVVVDKPSVYYPIEQYDSYSAFESETIRTAYDNNRISVQDLRKPRTFYFNPLSGKLFDTVINPVIIEPVVQFTAYVKVKYEMGKKK